MTQWRAELFDTNHFDILLLWPDHLIFHSRNKKDCMHNKQNRESSLMPQGYDKWFNSQLYDLRHNELFHQNIPPTQGSFGGHFNWKGFLFQLPMSSLSQLIMTELMWFIPIQIVEWHRVPSACRSWCSFEMVQVWQLDPIYSKGRLKVPGHSDKPDAFPFTDQF